MAEMSKTARRSTEAGMLGAVQRTPVAWVFMRKPGKVQTKPFATCFRKGEAEEIIAAHPELNLFLVKF